MNQLPTHPPVIPTSDAGDWLCDRLNEARAVIADIVHPSDHLIRLACNVLITHGETKAEREDARRLLVIIDARRPIRTAQREDNAAGGAE